MPTRLLMLAIALVLGAALYASAAVGSRPAPAAQPGFATVAPVQELLGTVTGSNRQGRWIDVHVTKTSRIVRVHTTPTTRWVSCSWSDIEHGHLIGVGVQKAGTQLLAVTIRTFHHPEVEH